MATPPDVETSRELGSLTGYPPIRDMDPDDKAAFVLRVAAAGIRNVTGKDYALLRRARRNRTRAEAAVA